MSAELKQTILTDEHLKLNAKMGEFAGFQMPLSYSSVKEEIAAVRNNAGVFDVSHMGEFWIEGEDAHKFVDTIITNDFINAGKQKAVYSPLCRENGTVIDDLIAYKVDDKRVLICVNASNMEKDWNWIEQKQQELKFNLTLSNHSENYSLLALQGPESELKLDAIGLHPEIEIPYYAVCETNYNNEKIIIARTGYTGEDGFEIFAPHNTIKEVWSKLLEQGVTPCGLVARDVLRIEVCYPLYGHELKNDRMPVDGGIGWTVKKNKPSFVGKEALCDYSARYKLIKLSLEKGIPREEYPVCNNAGEIIGEVSSGTQSPTLGRGIALCLIEKDKVPSDQTYSIQIRGKMVSATLHEKPFVTGGHK